MQNTSDKIRISLINKEEHTAESTETPTVAAPTAVNPGHGLGIASLVLSLVGVGLVGLILGIVGLNKSKKAGQKNGLAIAGIIIGAINLVVVTLIIIFTTLGAIALVSKCNELGSGTHIQNGVTYTCGGSTTTNTY